MDCRRTDSRTADLPPPSNWSPGAVRYVRVERSTRVLHRYARRHRDTFAGLYLEGAPDWTTIHVGFTGHLEAHEGRLRELYPYPAILRLFRACATEEELEHLQDRIPIGEKELRISTVGRDVKRNVVEVTFMQYDEDVARELRHRFGHALRVVRRDVIVRPLSSTARGPGP